MPLEVATYIHELVSTNPVGASDKKQQGDDHLRLIKAALLATFPNITGAMTATHTELNQLDSLAAVSVLGRSANSAGAPAAIAAAANDRLLRRVSDAVDFGQLTAGMFPNTVVPDAALSSNVPLKNAANTFTAAQTVSLSQAIYDFISTGANTPLLRGWVSSSHKGGFGIVHSANAWGTGSGEFDTLIYSVGSGLTVTLNNGSTVALRMNTAGAITATPNLSPAEVGYKGIPGQGNVNGNTTAAMSGGMIVLTNGDTCTIDDSVHPDNTVLFFVCVTGSATITISGATMYVAGSGFGTSGARTLAAGGTATAFKYDTNTWLISGAGLS